MSFPRYPKYKPSGVEWLGEVPEHWGVGQSRRLFSCRNERALGDDEQLTASQEHGIISQADFVRMEGRRVVEVLKGTDILKHVEPNDFVISMRSFQGGLEWSRIRGSISSAYVMLTPRVKLHEQYFAYLFKCGSYIQALQATTNLVRDGQAMRYGNFTQVTLPLVPLPEQRAIAAFLDRETAKIDALVAEQERLIELLAEKRQAVISHTVTKGLDPAAPMKPSGVEWLGDVPAHWCVEPLRRTTIRIEQGWSPPCESEAAEKHAWGVLKVGCVNGDVFDPSENKALPNDLIAPPELEVADGDLLMSRSNTEDLVGSAAIARIDAARLILCDLLYRVSVARKRIATEYLALQLRTPEARFQIRCAATGTSASMKKISQEDIRHLQIVIPPITEQVAITSFARSQAARLDALIDEAKKAIALLRERRSALISAAVTGQIDVRNAVPESAA